MKMDKKIYLEDGYIEGVYKYTQKMHTKKCTYKMDTNIDRYI